MVLGVGWICEVDLLGQQPELWFGASVTPSPLPPPLLLTLDILPSSARP